MKRFLRGIAIMVLAFLGAVILIIVSSIALVLIVLRLIFDWPYRLVNSLYRMLSAFVNGIMRGIAIGLGKKERKITVVGDVKKQEEE